MPLAHVRRGSSSSDRPGTGAPRARVLSLDLTGVSSARIRTFETRPWWSPSELIARSPDDHRDQRRVVRRGGRLRHGTGDGWFGSAVVRWHPTVQWLDGAGIADLLRSTSLYRQLDEPVRDPLLDAIAERVRAGFGDRLPRRYLSVLRHSLVMQDDLEALFVGDASTSVQHLRGGVDPFDVQSSAAELEEWIAVAAAELQPRLADEVDEAGVEIRVRDCRAQRRVQVGDECLCRTATGPCGDCCLL